MLWHHFRREVTHCELFETVQLLKGAAKDFFDRYNQTPERILSMIGVHPAQHICLYLVYWNNSMNTDNWQRMLWVIFIAQMGTAIGISCIFPFLSLYVTDLNSSNLFSQEFLVGAVFSVQALSMAIVSPLWGAVADRFGRKLMVQRSMFGGAIVLLLMGFVNSAEQLIVLRTIQGMLTGTLAATTALMAATVPPTHRGFAMGTLLVGQSGGVALGPLFGGIVADQYNYRTTFIVTSILMLASGILVSFGIVEKFPLEVGKRSQDKKMGFINGLRRIFQMNGVSQVYVLRFISNLARSMLLPFLPLFAASLLVGAEQMNTIIGLAVGVSAGAGALTSISLGRAGDRLGYKRILQWSAMLAGLFYFSQTFTSNIWQLLILQVIAGAAVGGIIPSLSALLSHYSEQNRIGTVFGVENSLVAAARAMAPILGATIVAWFGLQSIFSVAGLLYIVVAILAWWKLPQIFED